MPGRKPVMTKQVKQRSGTKREWFRRGVDALKTLFPDKPGVYGCPLCLRAFTEVHTQFLTFEHAPPRRLGGPEIGLLSRKCHGSGRPAQQ